MQRALKAATTIAAESGELLMKYYRKNVAVSYKHQKEPVSTADLESNDLIIRKISKAFPKHKILSEESAGLSQEITKEYTWVIDPLDGTSNYLAGIPLFGVAICLLKDKVPILGVIHDPVHKEFFTAVKGKGLKLNNKKIPKNGLKAPQFRKLMFLAGRSHDGRDQLRHGQIIYALESKINYFRRLGSAAIMLTSVATGRADAVILTGNKPWDTAAGALLVREGGGKVTDYCGREWTVDSQDLVASRGIEHAKITNITKKIEKDKC